MKKIAALFFIVISTAVLAHAQDSVMRNLPAQWTLQQSIEYAKANNIQVNILRLTTQSVQQDLIQSRNNRLPNLTGSVTQNLDNSNQPNSNGNGFR